MKNKIGVLLVNLGTPKTATRRDVYRYLIQFLTDPRVIDYSWIKRQLLVRGIIVPARYRQSTRSYQAIWTEEGSPLLVYGKKVQEKLQALLGEGYCVELAMRYQEPSIKEKLDKLINLNIERLVVLPLFPQYASATTGSVLQQVQKYLSQYPVIPHTTLIQKYPTQPKMIEAYCSNARTFDLGLYDHILFSFHGLPERQLKERGCLCNSICCLQQQRSDCYAAQCVATAQAIVRELQISNYSISFQSRLGKERWLQPYTSEVIMQLARQGKKRVLVFSPSFVCDCLETTYEIGTECALEFKHAGGEVLDLVPGLNDHPLWIEGLKQLICE